MADVTSTYRAIAGVPATVTVAGCSDLYNGDYHVHNHGEEPMPGLRWENKPVWCLHNGTATIQRGDSGSWELEPVTEGVQTLGVNELVTEGYRFDPQRRGGVTGTDLSDLDHFRGGQRFDYGTFGRPLAVPGTIKFLAIDAVRGVGATGLFAPKYERFRGGRIERHVGLRAIARSG